MVRKLALASLFFNGSEGSRCLSSTSSTSFSSAVSWQWPSCTQARTRSFRGDTSPEIVSMRHDTDSKREEQDEGYKYNNCKASMNPAYVHDYSAAADCYSSSIGLSDSSATQSVSLSTAPAESAVVAAADEDEAIIHGLRSSTTRRLLFEPESTSSIVKKTKKEAAFDGATALAIESADPYGDFRRSMEEMVLSHGADDWVWLEEMLGWYLRANGEKTHGLIVGAFVDLLVALASSSAPSPAVCSVGLKQSRHLQDGPARTGEHHSTQTE